MNFCKQVSLACALLLSSDVKAAGGSKKYDYLFNGADWPLDTTSQCSHSNQSPIDLRTDIHSDPFSKADGNEFYGFYVNLKKASSLNKGKVIQVNMPVVNSNGISTENYFTSQHSVDVLEGSKKYSAAQFHFHAKSEHTIMGRRYDLEMHTVHLADNYIDKTIKKAVGTDPNEQVEPFASAVGVIFDRYNYDPSITAEERQSVHEFFEALDFGSASADVDGDGNIIMAKEVDVPYGDMLKVANFANRWAYSGSLTTPPCTKGVYFQVAERVLPISEKHYQGYLDQQKKHTSVDYFDKDGKELVADATTTPASKTLDLLGNYRITNKIDFHNVHYMRQEYKADNETDPKTITLILAIFLAVAVVLALILGICACRLMGSEKTVEVEDEFAGEGGESERNNQLQMVSARSSVRV